MFPTRDDMPHDDDNINGSHGGPNSDGGPSLEHNPLPAALLSGENRQPTAPLTSGETTRDAQCEDEDINHELSLVPDGDEQTFQDLPPTPVPEEQSFQDLPELTIPSFVGTTSVLDKPRSRNKRKAPKEPPIYNKSTTHAAKLIESRAYHPRVKSVDSEAFFGITWHANGGGTNGEFTAAWLCLSDEEREAYIERAWLQHLKNRGLEDVEESVEENNN